MRELAFQHAGHNFHIAVRVRRKSSAARDAVVVHHAERAELHVLRIVIIRERKSEMRVQPAVVGMAAVTALANVDHDGPPESLMIILVITTIVKRHISSSAACTRYVNENT